MNWPQQTRGGFACIMRPDGSWAPYDAFNDKQLVTGVVDAADYDRNEQLMIELGLRRPEDLNETNLPKITQRHRAHR